MVTNKAIVKYEDGRICYLPFTHGIWFKRKSSARYYTVIKNELEKHLKRCDGVAIETATYERSMEIIDLELEGFEKNITDYISLKCVKEKKDLYYCDVFSSASDARHVMIVIAHVVGWVPIRLLLGLFGIGPYFTVLIFLWSISLVGPSLTPQQVKSIRRLIGKYVHTSLKILVPLIGAFNTFREITTAIQLRTLLKKLSRTEKNPLVMYAAHTGHVEGVRKYMSDKYTIQELRKKLDRMTGRKKIYKMSFRPPIKFAFSTLPEGKRVAMLEEARKKGLSVEKI